MKYYKVIENDGYVHNILKKGQIVCSSDDLSHYCIGIWDLRGHRLSPKGQSGFVWSTSRFRELDSLELFVILGKVKRNKGGRK
jgi:hypothetical protein